MLCVLIASIPITALFLPSHAPSAGEAEKAVVAAYSPHAPIFIDGDAGFDNSTGVIWGSGTPQDPFIIGNWEIDASGFANAIFIRNSNAYFRISGCHLMNAKADGIFLTGVSNGSLEGNNCSQNAFYGIALVYSVNNTISNNSCPGNQYGIDLLHSDRNTIVNNSCSGNAYYGIALVTSANNTISNNSCHFNQCGIDLQNSDGNAISNNSCSGGQYGVSLSRSENNSIAGNTFSLNQYSMQLQNSDHNTLSENACLSSAITGTYLDNSDNNTLSDNVILGNQYGIDFKKSLNIFPSNPDFYFYRIDNTYYARNNGTGAIMSSTDARVLIQSIVNSLDSRPSRFFFDSSEYIINSSLEHENQYFPSVVWEIGLRINKQISIICNGTTFKAVSILPNPFLVFYIDNADFVEIIGAHIDCNQAGQLSTRWVMGIATFKANYLLIEHCEIEDFGAYGIFIDVGSSYPTVRYNYLHDQGNDPSSNYNHGICLHNNGEEGLVLGNRVDDIGFGKYAIFIDSVDKVRVIGNIIGEAAGLGIVVSDECNSTLIVGNNVTRRSDNSKSIVIIQDSNNTQVIDNHIYGNSSKNKTFGSILVNDMSCKKTIIKNNHLDNAIIIDDSHDAVIFSNDGYLLEDKLLAFNIYWSGSDYRARNATGVLKYTDSNFSALMTSVLADAAERSKIMFEEGNYTVENSGAISADGSYYGLMINKSVRFEGMGAFFVMADNVNCNYSMMYVENVSDFKVEGIAFDVNTDGQTIQVPSWSTCGIQINGSIRPVVQKCEFYDFTSSALKINGNPAAPTTKEHYIIEGKTFSRNTVYGVLLSSSCNNNRFNGNNCSGSTGYGLKISFNSTGNAVWNNTFRHNNCTKDAYDPSISQAFDGCRGNWWNTTGTPHGYGNHWSDWQGRDIDSDGIQDLPYNLSGSSHQIDFYPLAVPFTAESNFIPDFTVPGLIGNIGENGWYVSAVYVPWIPSNDRVDYGIYYMFYRLDGGVLWIYAGQIPIGGSGSHILEFLILDVAENLEVVASTSFKIDVQSPLVDISVSGKLGANEWYLTNVSVTMTTTDDASGLNLTKYRFNGGLWYEKTWQNGPIRFNLSDGINDVQYYATDNASNQGPIKGLRVKVDTGAPVIEIIEPYGQVDHSNVMIAWDSDDEMSGIANFEVVVDGGDPRVVDNLTSSAVYDLKNGNHSVVVKATDLAGNSAESELTFTVEVIDQPPADGGNYITLIALMAIISAGIVVLYLRSEREKRLRGKQDE